MLNHRLHVAHAPHRWYALEEKEHGVNQLRVVGGVCNCCLKVALQFYDGSSTNNGILSDHSILLVLLLMIIIVIVIVIVIVIIVL